MFQDFPNPRIYNYLRLFLPNPNSVELIRNAQFLKFLQNFFPKLQLHITISPRYRSSATVTRQKVAPHLISPLLEAQPDQDPHDPTRVPTHVEVSTSVSERGFQPLWNRGRFPGKKGV